MNNASAYLDTATNTIGRDILRMTVRRCVDADTTGGWRYYYSGTSAVVDYNWYAKVTFGGGSRQHWRRHHPTITFTIWISTLRPRFRLPHKRLLIDLRALGSLGNI